MVTRLSGTGTPAPASDGRLGGAAAVDLTGRQIVHSAPVTDPAELPRFDDRVVLVTGGCRGHRPRDRAALRRGGRARRDLLPPRARDLPDGWLFVAADVREPEQVDAVIAATVERFGALDVLVNNAGGSPPADTATASPRFTAGIIALNLTAALVFAQKANAVMQAQERRRQHRQHRERERRPAVAEHALRTARRRPACSNATQTLAVELAPKVRVNAVVVGLVVTEQAHLFYGDEEGIARGRRDGAAWAHGRPDRRRRRVPVPRVAARPLRDRRAGARARRRRASELHRGQRKGTYDGAP